MCFFEHPKPPERFAFQLFDRIKSHRRLPSAPTNQTVVDRKLCNYVYYIMRKELGHQNMPFPEMKYGAILAVSYRKIKKVIIDHSSFGLGAFDNTSKSLQ